MNCNSCTRKTLGLFIETVAGIKPLYIPRTTPFRQIQASHFSSAARRSQESQKSKDAAKPKKPQPTKDGKPITFLPRRKEVEPRRERPERPKEPWQLHKEALKEKLGGEAWNPRKKLSPDTMDGIRHLHQTQPEKFTTPVLAKHFKVSPEAIRRILKSKWKPSDEEEEERTRRWDKRGERIWTNLVEMGVKPPKKWREMGVGRAEPGKKPVWKSDTRNTVAVNDGWKAYEEEGGFREDEDLIPIVDGKTGTRLSTAEVELERKSLLKRL